MKRVVILFILGILVASVFVLAAKPNVLPSQNHFPVIVPSHAVQVAEGVFSLGKSVDVDGKVVEGLMFVHNKREDAKPSWAGGNGNGKSKCYEFLAKGAKWKETENYVIADDIDSSMIETSIETWDSEVVDFEIFGINDLNAIVDGDDLSSPDGKNEVLNKNLGETNTIAYAIVWGIFYGPPSGRELVEWDIVFNSDYNFGDIDPENVDSNVMDYQNIATHELGHALGMGHPDSGCTDETMYAFASNGETKKRSLNAGDIAGISDLY